MMQLYRKILAGVLVGSLVGFSAVASLANPYSQVLAQTPYPITPPVQTVTQTFNWETGYNFFGITVDKGSNYKASDLLYDLNWSFVELPPRPMGGNYYGALQVIYRWDTQTQKWEYYTTWGAGNNFTIRIGEGYIIRNYDNASGSSVSGTGVGLSVYPALVASGWSLISLPENRNVRTAEEVLQSMSSNGINAAILAKYDSTLGRYIVHYANSQFGNFQVQAGDGFWVYSSGGGSRW